MATIANRHAVKTVKQFTEIKFVTKVVDIVTIVAKIHSGDMRVRKNVRLDATDLFVTGPQGYA